MEKNAQQMRLVEALTYLKRQRKITQAKLAEMMGTSQAAISRNVTTAGMREINKEFLAAMNSCVGNIFNLDYIVNGRGELLSTAPAEEQKTEPKGNNSIMELYAQLIHEVEQLRTELNTQLREVKDVREQLTQEREALQNISQQLTATLMGARGQYPIPASSLPLAADGTPLSPMCGAPQCPVTFPQPCAPTLPVGSPSHPTENTTNK